MAIEDLFPKWRIELNWRARVFEYVGHEKRLKRKNDSCSLEQYCKSKGIDPSGLCWWLEYMGREDTFTYYRSFATEYLARARRALELLEHYIDLDPKLRMPLMRDAIISYAALFRKSHGRLFTKYDLEAQTFVPKQLQDIHQTICTHRDVVIAHCDLGPRDPMVSPIAISLRGKGFYWEDYKALIPQFKELIEAVRNKLDSYVAQENLASVEEAFEDLSSPPAAALEDPGRPCQ